MLRQQENSTISPSKASVPAGILESIRRGKALLPEGAQKARAKMLERATRQLQRQAGEREALRARMNAAADRYSPVNIRAVDEVAWAYLTDISGKEAQALRPTSGLNILSNPAGTSSEVIGFANKVEDIYQHSYVGLAGHDELTAGALLGFLVPFGGPIVGPIVATTGSALPGYHSFSFYDHVAPDDGTYLVTAVVVAWGKYSVLAADGPGDHKHAQVKIAATTLGVQNPRDIVLLDREGMNIDERDRDFSELVSFSGYCPLKAGQRIPFQVFISVTASATGSDTQGIVNTLPGVGALACLGCTLEKAGALPLGW